MLIFRYVTNSDWQRAVLIIFRVIILLVAVGFCRNDGRGQVNSGKDVVRPHTQLPPAEGPIKYATSFDWTASPRDDLSGPGTKTLHLAACPLGVTASEPEYWVYVSEAGNPEAAKVAGGTCKGDDQQGTLIIGTSKPHAAGYVIRSASSGLQEASIAARVPLTNPSGPMQGGKVIAPPGEFRIYGRLSLRTINQTIDFSGSVFECWLDDSCIFVGDPRNSNLVSNVTLINPRGRPTVLHGQKPMIEVNGQKTRIVNLMTRSGINLGRNQAGTFGSYLQVDDDQAFLLDGVDSTAGWGLECTPSFCGTLVTAPGPFNRNSAVGWIKNAQISMQCMGNGVNWDSGNTLRISDSVIQGYSQFGVRAGLARGGYGNVSMDNVYMEDSGACPNPTGNIGTAGVLIRGGPFSFQGGEGPSGHFPAFAKDGEKANTYVYYVVLVHPRWGHSNPLLFGYAQKKDQGNITLTWPDSESLPPDTQFDILRTQPQGGIPQQAPYGKGAYAIARGLVRKDVCAKGVCMVTDSQKPAADYQVAPPDFFPKLDYWPGTLVLSTSGDTNSVTAPATAHLSTLGSGIVDVLGLRGTAVTADYCPAVSGWTPLWATCIAAMPPTTYYPGGSLLMANKPNNDGGLLTNLKGRINLLTSGSGPGHLITLVDSDVQKTVATANNRPFNDPNDSYIGFDHGDGNARSVGISFGAAQSMSNYIGNPGDGKNWKERLTDKQKTFAVPVVIEGGSTLTIGGGTAISQMKVYAASVPGSRVPSQSCQDLKEPVSGLTAADLITGITPPKSLGNLSLNAYPTAGAITLHVCNPSTSPVDIPSGKYSFLAVH